MADAVGAFMDFRMFHAVNGMAGHIDQIDDFFEFAARLLPLALIPLLLALWFWPRSRHDRDNRQWSCLAAVSSAAVALGINQIIIRLWDRPRPFADHSVHLLLAPSGDPSFPSDHATFVFAIATAMLLVHRRAGMIAVCIAITVSFARIYVGEHYVSDVIAGALFGATIAVIVNQTRPLVLPILEPLFRLTRRFHLG